MAITYGFFNSVNGDRTYNADTIGNMFKGLIGEGIYRSFGDAFIVQPLSGLTLTIGSGRAIVGDKWVENDAAISITLNPPHVTLNRYTAIVLRLNRENREITLEMIDGENSSSPVKPSIIRTDTIYDICLAYIRVTGGATTITTFDITDTRSDTSLCGFVTMLTNLNIQRSYADYNNTSSTRYINIPTDLDYESSDLLDIYIGGIWVSPSEYIVTMNEIENIPMVQFTNTIDANNILSFVVTKSVIIGGVTGVMAIVDEINGEVV